MQRLTRSRVEAIKAALGRIPWAGDAKIGEMYGVKSWVVQRIRAEELGIHYSKSRREEDEAIFTKEEMARLDTWLAEREKR